MGALEELRTLLQDIIAPDRKSLAVCRENVEKQVAALEQRIEARFDKVDAHFDTLEHDSEKCRNQVGKLSVARSRMNKVERVLENFRKRGQ